MRLPIWEFKFEKLLSQIDMAAKLKEYEVNSEPQGNEVMRKQNRMKQIHRDKDELEGKEWLHVPNDFVVSIWVCISWQFSSFFLLSLGLCCLQKT